MISPLRLRSFQIRGIHISNWHESDIISDRKSRFQARHTDLKDAAEIPDIIQQLLSENKSIAKNASHPHMLAWRTGVPTDKGYANVQQGFKDNGEKGSGSVMLELMVKQNVMNKLLIVTRWYGGNPIGSLRFRHISNCSYETLRKGETTKNVK